MTIVDQVVNRRIRDAYITILSAVTQVCKSRIGIALPIILHGYSYSVPDGRGFAGGWGPLPGPWLEPGFRQKGYEDINERKSIIEDLLDVLNRMQVGITALPAFEHVTHVNLLTELSTEGDYKRWWANELHPTRRGFDKITAIIRKAI